MIPSSPLEVHRDDPGHEIFYPRFNREFRSQNILSQKFTAESVDKKGKWKDTKGNSKADDDTFKLIMKNKEQLLGNDEPLCFIFSHSALREGWDNPNVFQICTLNETTALTRITCEGLP